MKRTMTLVPEQLAGIHHHTVAILEKAGIDLRHAKACERLKKKGFKTDGTKVYISEHQLMEAIRSTPGSFTITSPTSGKQIEIGGDYFVMTSTSGASSVMDIQGNRRPATQSDYLDFLRLNHTSDVLELVSPLIVYPTDIPADQFHVEMMTHALTMTDKPCGALAVSPEGTRQSIEILACCCGSRETLKSDYHSVFNINVLSPLGFSPDEVESLMEIARANQPTTITNMAMAGATAPIRTEDAVVMGNAEILGGLVLAQAFQPGLPVIYGSTSSAVDMTTLSAVLGSPETLQIQRCMIDLANYYGLACRTGGSLTDAHLPDGRAMSESALTLENAICHGAHVIIHACGMMSSYMAAGFEKWIMDEEVCRVVTRSVSPLDFRTVDPATIITIGSRGSYLTHPDTFRRCRSVFRSPWKKTLSHEKWLAGGGRTMAWEAKAAVRERLSSYERPDFGPGLEKDLSKRMKK